MAGTRPALPDDTTAEFQAEALVARRQDRAPGWAGTVTVQIAGL